MTIASLQKISLRSGDSLVYGALLIGGLSATYPLALFLNASEPRAAILLIAGLALPLLAYISFRSTKVWIPVLICLLVVRDFNLGGIVGEGSLKIGDLFIAYLFCLWFLREVLIEKSTRIVTTGLDFFLIVLVVFHVLSLSWSPDTDHGIVRILKLIRDLMLYLILRDLFIRDFQGSYRKATAAYIATGLALLAVYSYVVLSTGGLGDFLALSRKETLTSLDLGALRARGTGGGFLISGPCAWFLLAGVLALGSLMTQTRRSVIIAIPFLTTLFILSAMLTLQRSVIVLILLLLTFLLIGSLYLRYKKNVLAIAVVLLVFLTIGASLNLGSIFAGRFKNAFQDGSWVQRAEFYESAIDAFRNNPALGVGAGGNYSWQQYFPEIAGNRSRIVHSTYLLVLSETGIAGFLLFLTVLFFWLKYLWNSMRDYSRDPFSRSACMVLLAFSASYLVYLVQVGEFEEFEPWLVMAIACAAWKQKPPAGEMETRISPPGVETHAR